MAQRTFTVVLNQSFAVIKNTFYFFPASERQATNDAENTEIVGLPRQEVIKRLRERGHPIWLFGENELNSFKRLRRIEIQEPEANRVSNLTNMYYKYGCLDQHR